VPLAHHPRKDSLGADLVLPTDSGKTARLAERPLTIPGKALTRH
jgi:hypothetical protein